MRECLYLIPDVSVFWPTGPSVLFPDKPPFIAIEILSQEDRMLAVREKLREYHVWGVRHIWLVDPY